MKKHTKSALILFVLLLPFSLSSLGKGGSNQAGPKDRKETEKYSVEQAMSEKAQLHTIAFSGVAFMTGTFGADTFLPPGKAADYFGFQYMRDIDAAEAGHNMMFLTYIANNIFDILEQEQLNLLKELAREQVPQFRTLAEMRLPMIMAFRMHMEGNYPEGYSGLSQEAVISHTADIFELDGKLSYRRAETFGLIANSLTASQKEEIAKLHFGDSSTWPEKTEILDKRALPHEENILMMTYASEFFSWYAGSEKSDVYFCPERHGTYFGGFYMKDYPAMGNPDYYIPTKLTGESGEVFLTKILTDNQRKLIEEITDLQREWLNTILSIRTDISREFRGVLNGSSIDENKILTLSRQYGEMDGAMSGLYADRFAQVKKSLSPEQEEQLIQLRNQNTFPDGIYYYATPAVRPQLDELEKFFLKGKE